MGIANKGRRRIVFRLSAPEAEEVAVSGDFNEWKSKKHPLKKGPGGMWEKTVMLPPGRYEYKFLVDGSWRPDPANSEFSVNSFGTRNSVINVMPRDSVL